MTMIREKECFRKKKSRSFPSLIVADDEGATDVPPITVTSNRMILRANEKY